MVLCWILMRNNMINCCYLSFFFCYVSIAIDAASIVIILWLWVTMVVDILLKLLIADTIWLLLFSTACCILADDCVVVYDLEGCSWFWFLFLGCWNENKDIKKNHDVLGCCGCRYSFETVILCACCFVLVAVCFCSVIMWWLFWKDVVDLILVTGYGFSFETLIPCVVFSVVVVVVVVFSVCLVCCIFYSERWLCCNVWLFWRDVLDFGLVLGCWNESVDNS